MQDDESAEKIYQVGYASGVFDLFHVGHLNILRRARARCRHLVVGVASDGYVAGLKGSAPVIPFDERLDIVSAIGIVDEVIADHDEDKSLAWERSKFDVIFKGDDWRGAPKGRRLEADMRSLGVDVVYFPYTSHTSSAMLRARLKKHKWL